MADDLLDEGYSNLYGNRAHQQGAWEDYEAHDEVPEDGLRSAIGSMTGTESNAKVESLVGVQHDLHIEDTICCEPGDSAVMVRFGLLEDKDLVGLEEQEDEIINSSKVDDPALGDSSQDRE